MTEKGKCVITRHYVTRALLTIDIISITSSGVANLQQKSERIITNMG